MSFQKRNKWIFSISIFSIIISIAVINYVLKPPIQIENLKPVYSGKSLDFIKLASKDFSKWHTKTIEITGKVSDVIHSDLILDDFIFCRLQETMKHNIKPNTLITIKGIIIGYDELLNELKLDQCIVK